MKSVNAFLQVHSSNIANLADDIAAPIMEAVYRTMGFLDRYPSMWFVLLFLVYSVAFFYIDKKTAFQRF